MVGQGRQRRRTFQVLHDALVGDVVEEDALVEAGGAEQKVVDVAKGQSSAAHCMGLRKCMMQTSTLDVPYLHVAVIAGGAEEFALEIGELELTHCL